MARHLIDEAAGLAAAGRWEQVLGLLHDQSLPGEAGCSTLLFRAQALHALGRREQAKEEARLRLGEGGSIAAAAGLAISVCCTDPVEARRLLRHAVVEADRGELPFWSLKLRVELAGRLLNSGDLGGAKTALEDAHRADPAAEEHHGYQLVRADLAKRRGEIGEARSWLSRATTSPRAHVRAQANHVLAALELQEGRPRAALAAAEAGLEAVEGNLAVGSIVYVLWNSTGDARRAIGDLAGARTAYLNALAGKAPLSDASMVIPRCNLAMVALAIGDIAEARARFEEIQNTRHPLIELGVALGLAACAIDAGDREAWSRVLGPLVDGLREGTPRDADLAELAVLGATWAEERGWMGVAAISRRIALQVWLGVPDLADAQREALARLASAGAGPLLGPFEVVRSLAEGGSGRVLLARHRTGLQVAIKLLKANAAEHDGQPLDNELRALARLDHPGVVGMLDYGRVDATAAAMTDLKQGALWIAFELAPHGDLHPWLGRMAFDEVQRILVQILDALAHAHARGVLHLDVKPGNVLKTTDRAVLADFGLAIRTGDAWQPAGTPQFMAPEQFEADVTKLGPWTDLYAVGCLAVAMVTGRPPFEGDSIGALRRAHTERPLLVSPTTPVPRGLVGWVLRMTAKRPSDRFASAAEAARALRFLGSVVADGAPTEPALVARAETLVLPAVDDLGPVPAVPSDGAMPRPQPYVPLGWGSRVPPRARESLAHARLGLFGLRSPRFVGRNAQRDLMWTTLRAVHASGEPQILAIEAAAGHGSSALAAWMIERCRELGAAQIWTEPSVWSAQRTSIVWLDDPEPHVLERMDPSGPLLVLASAATGSAAIERLLERGAVPIPLGPLPREEALALLDGLLPLDTGLAEELVERAAGCPAMLHFGLTELVQRARLRPGPDGFGTWGPPRDEVASTLEDVWRRRIRHATRGRQKDLAALGQAEGRWWTPPSGHRVLAARLVATGMARPEGDRLRLASGLARALGSVVGPPGAGA